MIYYTCSYLPLEVLMGSDIAFQRLMTSSPTLSHELGCNLCGYAKTVYQKGMELDSNDCLLIVDSCDAMRRVGDLLDELSLANVFILRLPWKRDGEAVRFLAAEIQRLVYFLESSGISTDLREGIRRFNELVDFVQANEKRLAAEDLTDLYFQALNGMQATYTSKYGATAGKSRLAITGGITDIGALDAAVEKAGGMIVANDTCLGGRPFSEKTQEKPDPLHAVAERLLKWRSPCARFSEGEFRSNGEVDATVFVVPKFCDFYDFVRPNDGKSVYRIELDYPINSQGQLSTRIGALMEKNSVRSVSPSKEGMKMLFAGVDSGSTTTNGVLIDKEGRIIFSKTLKTGVRASNTAEALIAEMTEVASKEGKRIGKCVSTGYGRLLVSSASDRITEISCHARGVFALFPEARGIIDIGGQDSKVIRLSPDGNVDDFAMNDKCAAGTGRFLEVTASALELEIDEMALLARKRNKDVSISSVCTVFAESEVVSLIGMGERIENISSGLFRAIAKRVGAMYSRLGSPVPLVFTGGVARNSGVVDALKELFGTEIIVPEAPEIVGAFGAALIARDSVVED